MVGTQGWRGSWITAKTASLPPGPAVCLRGPDSRLCVQCGFHQLPTLSCLLSLHKVSGQTVKRYKDSHSLTHALLNSLLNLVARGILLNDQTPPLFRSHYPQSRNQSPSNGCKASVRANFFSDLHLEFTDPEFFAVSCAYINLCILLGEPI